MNQLIKLVTFLLASNAGAHQTSANDMIISKASRQHREAVDIPDSNDLLDLSTFQIYNCEGMFMDMSGPASASGGSFVSTVVEYDYDLFIESGSDLTSALAKFQRQLLGHVGKDLFSDCSRRLADSAAYLHIATERQLDGATVEELTSAPSDVVTVGASCIIEDDSSTSSTTECYPITGYITAYYAASEDIRRLSDGDAINAAILASVKSAMDDGTLTSADDVSDVYYLGDRDTYTFRSAESYLEESPQTEPPSFWDQNRWIIMGSGVGAVVMALAAVLHKKRSSSSRKKNESEEGAHNYNDEPGILYGGDMNVDIEQREGPPEDDRYATAGCYPCLETLVSSDEEDIFLPK